MSGIPLLLVDGYALPVIVRCCTEAYGRGLADAVGILSGWLAAPLTGDAHGFSSGLASRACGVRLRS
jgi:hypothetical protein